MRFTGVTREITTQGGAFTTNYLERFFRKYQNTKHKIARLYPQFSLSAIVEGMGNVKGVEGLSKSGKSVNGNYVEWELLGESTMAVNFANGGTTGTAVGGNLTTFNICLDSDYFNQNDVGKIESGQLLFFESNAIPQASGKYLYQVSIFGADLNETVNANKYCVPGRRISYSYNAQGELSDKGYIKSRKGSEMHREYITTWRHDFEISGHANMTEYEIVDDNSGVKFFISHAEKIFYENIFFTKERILLEGRSTIDKNGIVRKFDPRTKQPIYAGNGIEAQLDKSCKQTYTKLTKNMLKEAIYEVAERSGKSDGIDIMLMTGSQGERMFLDLMEDSLKLGDNVYATRSGNNITLGGNFNKFIYGNHTITVAKNYVLDYKEDATELDSEGKPLSSSKMFFIDKSKYDGEPNLMAMHQNGFAMVVNTILGVGGKDGKSSGEVSSPVHASKKIAMGSIGLRVLNPYSSLILEKKVV
jgi:hypothetical protein